MCISTDFSCSLEEDIFQYAKHNLAVVNVYIKDPVVTRISRDQKIPIIAFVANTGGLLGLCMGFSLVSVFEIVYHILGSLRKYWANSQMTHRRKEETASLEPNRTIEENAFKNLNDVKQSNGRINNAAQDKNNSRKMPFFTPLKNQGIFREHTPDL